MEILTGPGENARIRTALFDFDGTLSTLRYGWEGVMEPLMLSCIAGDTPVDDALIQMVRDYIDQSTGIQTIQQMEWLCETVHKAGRNPGMPDDPWWYKQQYNTGLLEMVEERRKIVKADPLRAEDYRMLGALEYIKALHRQGVALYAASGTDEADVRYEAELLGFSPYFTAIEGAKPGSRDCSKEAVLRGILSQNRLSGDKVAVFGDGRVEIALGRECGAVCIGVIGAEADRGQSPDEHKRKRLISAGANVLICNFQQLDGLLNTGEGA